MFSFTRQIDHLHYIEECSHQDSYIHKIDPRAKVLSTFLILIAALSLPKFDIAGLIPFFLYPLALLRGADLSSGYLLKRSLIVLPFVFFIGIFNPLFDQRPFLHWRGYTLSSGWVSFFSILLRGYLTAFIALTLVSTTGFHRICHALKQMGIPALLTTQLILLYRSIFILTEEAARMLNAWRLRNPANKKLNIKIWGYLLGHLLLRSFDKSKQVYHALLARGFQGDITPLRPLKWTARDTVFILICIITAYILRFHSPFMLLGRYIETRFS